MKDKHSLKLLLFSNLYSDLRAWTSLYIYGFSSINKKGQIKTCAFGTLALLHKLSTAQAFILACTEFSACMFKCALNSCAVYFAFETALTPTSVSGVIDPSSCSLIASLYFQVCAFGWVWQAQWHDPYSSRNIVLSFHLSVILFFNYLKSDL